MGLEASENKKNHRLLKKQHIKCGDGWIEDFDHVINHTDLKPDKLWYLQNQCEKNICTLFKPLMKRPHSLLEEAIDAQKLKRYGLSQNNNVLAQVQWMEGFGIYFDRDDQEIKSPETIVASVVNPDNTDDTKGYLEEDEWEMV